MLFSRGIQYNNTIDNSKNRIDFISFIKKYAILVFYSNTVILSNLDRVVYIYTIAKCKKNILYYAAWSELIDELTRVKYGPHDHNSKKIFGLCIRVLVILYVGLSCVFFFFFVVILLFFPL